MKQLLAALLVVAGGVMVAGGGSAQASCFAPPGTGTAAGPAAQIAAAPVLFVGTVLGTTSNHRIARVRVESVWKGPRVPAEVTVVGTPDPGSGATSVDRTFVEGRRYLFAPSNAESPFQDSNCSSTQPYTPALDALRPPDAQAPVPGAAGPDPTRSSIPGWAWPAGLAVLLGAGFLAWRRFGART